MRLRNGGERGSVLAEFAMVLPVLILLFFVSFDLGMSSQETVVLSEVVHSAVRSAVHSDSSASGAETVDGLVQRVRSLLRGTGLDDTAFSIWVRTSSTTLTQTGAQKQLLSMVLKRSRGTRLSGFLHISDSCVKDAVLLPELVQAGNYTLDSEPAC